MHRNSAHWKALGLCAAALILACERKLPPEPRETTVAETKGTVMSIYDTDATSLDGEKTSLESYAGRVTLLVNVASECGYTPQYAGLQRLHETYKERGFVVLGFPSNDFGQQEPGSEEQIRAFCSSKYRVDFPMFAKVQTKAGSGQAPVYAALQKAANVLPSWNFGKYLIGRDGRVLEYFPSKVEPEDPKLIAALEAALAARP